MIGVEAASWRQALSLDTSAPNEYARFRITLSQAAIQTRYFPVTQKIFLTCPPDSRRSHSSDKLTGAATSAGPGIQNTNSRQPLGETWRSAAGSLTVGFSPLRKSHDKQGYDSVFPCARLSTCPSMLAPPNFSNLKTGENKKQQNCLQYPISRANLWGT